MNQNNNLSPQLIKAMQDVLNYLWESEQADFETSPRPDHVFLSLQELHRALEIPE